VVLPVTQVLGDIVASYGVDPKRIVVIPNGINLERFDSAPDVARPPSARSAWTAAWCWASPASCATGMAWTR
jgi:glycosyltransferase involved in cell wall biosynthesis